ncbi:hypothetical protein H9P43_009050 [Blastocladiella emersonii ATCC 22665]|nr:hypothetical protein H9P43_009050 [Blastocladiella emersonii ATCC 22665]
MVAFKASLAMIHLLQGSANACRYQIVSRYRALAVPLAVSDALKKPKRVYTLIARIIVKPKNGDTTSLLVMRTTRSAGGLNSWKLEEVKFLPARDGHRSVVFS